MIATAQQLIKLKIRASDVAQVPFDIVYIVNKELKPLLPKMLPYSLVLPMNDDLVDRMKHIVVHEHRSLTTSEHRVLERKPGQTVYVMDLLDLVALRQSFLVVPVLPRTHEKTRNTKRKDRNPAYLVAQMHRTGTYVDRKGASKTRQPVGSMDDFRAFFNDFAVAFTPRGPVRPICRMCPRHLEHVQGKCTLGEMKCYESLVIQPDRSQVDEQLQENGAD